MTTPDDTPSIPADDPTAAARGRNRHPGAAVPGGPGDPVVARLRMALDELTAGAEPNTTTATALTTRRPRRWMLPAVAAAAVAVVVGVAIAVVGRDDGGTPAAPTPTGPPVTPVPVRAATIPWYGLTRPDGVSAIPPIDVDPADFRASQVWASPDYSRVLVATSSNTPEASTPPDDWPVLSEIADPPAGVAWAFSIDDSTGGRDGIYWAPDDETSVVVTGFGFSPDDLAAVLPALHVERDQAGPRVASALSSLAPLPDGTGGLYTSPYAGPDLPITDGQSVALFVSAGGAARALGMWGPGALAITPTTTPFGPGLRIVTDGPAHVWWQVDDGPFWAGLSAPEAQIDDILSRVTRVADIPAPAPVSLTDGPTVAETAPTSTSPGPSIPTNPNEPAMTAVMPSFPGGDDLRPPIAVGESVMLSAGKSLGAAGITVYAEEAIQAAGIAEELERLRDIEAFGDVVIIQVGTNGTVTEVDLDRMMRAVADVERVVVLTAHADGRSWIAPNNQLIRALPQRYPHVVIVDWDAIASTCGDCLTSDGIHVEDRDLYAGAIAEAAGLG